MLRTYPLSFIFGLGVVIGITLTGLAPLHLAAIRPTERHQIVAVEDALAGMSIDHVALVTRDYEGLTRWYVEKLGFRIDAEWTAPQVVPGLQLSYLVHPSGVRLEIAGAESVEALGKPASSVAEDFGRAGFRHVCFSVASVDAAHDLLKSRGVKVLAPPFDFPKLRRRLALLQDPDGNVLEFVAPMEGAASATSKSDVELIRGELARWRELWSLKGAGRSFDLAGYEDLYVSTEGAERLLVFDSWVPDWASTQIDGFDDYRKIWHRAMADGFPEWKITRLDVVRLEVDASGTLAWSAVNLWGEGRRADGDRYVGSQHGTHVWKKVAGRWRILHEHLTSPITVHGVANAVIDGRAQTAPRPR